MPEQEQFKRNVAFKIRLKDILIGNPVTNDGKFAFLELGDKKIVRVNVVGNIVERYEGQGEKKYLNFTLDDGSGQIRLKVFGDDVAKFNSFSQGLTVIVIGLLRYWNDEIYIAPEIIKEVNPRYLLLRKLETEKDKGKLPHQADKNQIIAIKDKLLELIKTSEENGGIERDKIIMDLQEISPVMINQEIQKLLEEGIIFEPRPGKVRYLG